MVLPQWAFGAAVALMVIGLVGAVVPVIPGLGWMWIVVLVYAIAERFRTIDPLSFAVLTLLGLGGMTADIWLGQLGAKVTGASLASILCSLAGGLLGGLIGFLIGGLGALLGTLIGSILGVLLNEYRERREWKPAWKATLGLLVGFTLSSAVKIAIGLAMLGLFVWQVLRG
jgi:uncharacterized protein YqgC (DUF456 family)